MNEDHALIRSQGPDYMVGWEEDGWFVIERVVLTPVEAIPSGLKEHYTILEHEGERYGVESDGARSRDLFNEDAAEALLDALQQGLE